jgi:hypothetical protein
MIEIINAWATVGMAKPWSRIEMSRKRRASGFFLVACLLLGGCSGSGRPDLAPVQGKVTYKGEAVSGATVVFLCPGAPRMAIGTTDAGGIYKLTSYEPNDGAMIGTHSITVTKFGGDGLPEVTSAPVDSKDMNKAIEQSMRQSAQAVVQAEKKGSGLPIKYSQMHTTDLKKEVVEGENVINLELTD